MTQWHQQLRRWVLLPLVVVALVGCSGGDEPEDQSTDPTTDQTADTATTDPDSLVSIAPSSINTKVTTNYNLATNAAKAWREDAVLTYVSVELPASLKQDSGNEVYVFGSAADTANWWTYSISQDTGKFVRAIIPKEDFLGASLDPVNIDYWNMNYVEALQLAENNGGLEFRNANSGTQATVFLSQRAPRGWLWWTVEYNTPSGNQFTLLVNPNRGEVVNEQGDEVAAPADDSGLTDPSTQTSPATDATDTTTPTGSETDTSSSSTSTL